MYQFCSSGNNPFSLSRQTKQLNDSHKTKKEIWNQDHHNHLDTYPTLNIPNKPSSPSPHWGTPSSHHSQPPPPPPPPHHSYSVSHPPPPHHSQHHLNPHSAMGVRGGGGTHIQLELLRQHTEQQHAAARQHQQRHL